MLQPSSALPAGLALLSKKRSGPQKICAGPGSHSREQKSASSSPGLWLNHDQPGSARCSFYRHETPPNRLMGWPRSQPVFCRLRYACQSNLVGRGSRITQRFSEARPLQVALHPGQAETCAEPRCCVWRWYISVRRLGELLGPTKPRVEAPVDLHTEHRAVREPRPTIEGLRAA